MKYLSTTCLIIALVIVVNHGGVVKAQETASTDQVAEESKRHSVTIVDGPKYVQPPNNTKAKQNQTQNSDQRPPNKPQNPSTDIQVKQKYYVDPPRYYKIKIHPSLNTVYKYPRVIPLPSHLQQYYTTPQRPLVFSASTGQPIIAKTPKFSLPVQTINGIRTDVVKPPKFVERRNNATSTTTTLGTTTTTRRPLRTRRIWPKHILDKMNTTYPNVTVDASNSANITTNKNGTDYDASASYRVRYVYTNRTSGSTTPQPTTRGGYRRVTRVPNHQRTSITSTLSPTNFTRIEPNDWVPIIPLQHHPKGPKRKYKPINRRADETPISRRSDLTPMSRRSDLTPMSRSDLTPMSRRSDLTSMSRRPNVYVYDAPEGTSPKSKRLLYLQTFGLVPVDHPLTKYSTHITQGTEPEMSRKKMVFFRKRMRQLNPYVYSGYSTNAVMHSPSSYIVDDLQPEATHHHPKVVTKIKHHHHHHHHRYIKTVEKPVKVPYKVHVPMPYPVTVEKKVPVAVEKIKVVEKPVPYPVTVEKRVPYPVGIKVPHPVPVKVVEKEYVPKPYPVIHHVPVVKRVEVRVPHPVPVEVEKRVPYPVKVQVPVQVDRPFPVEVEVEKQVPYPVPVRVLVPQPYPVEKRVPYPVEVKVKEPYEVIKHVRVPYPKPYPVKVPVQVPVPVEKRVPYPVEVEKKVPVPYEVIVPQKVEVEKKVPVYVPQPYPVEKRVPVPVKVPYPIRVPVKVPVPFQIPVFMHAPSFYNDGNSGSGSAEITSNFISSTSSPHQTVTVHGNLFTGFQSRSDKPEPEAQSAEATTSSPSIPETTTTVKP